MSLSLTVSQSVALDRLARMGLCRQGSTQEEETGAMHREIWWFRAVGRSARRRSIVMEFRDSAGKAQTAMSRLGLGIALAASSHVHILELDSFISPVVQLQLR